MNLYLSLAIPIVLMTCWLYTAHVARTSFPRLRNKAICLLIAHPDDEAMFFAPTVLGLTAPELGNHLKILCLSSGNADNLGEIRKEEIVVSAKLLGLRSDADVLVVDDAALPDGPTTWDAEKVAAVLASAFATPAAKKPAPTKKQSARGGDGGGGAVSADDGGPRATIDVLITFDRTGISHHPNHISVYHGAVVWLRGMMRGHTGWACPVTLYTLTSTSIVRKYISFVDAPLTMLQCVLNSMADSGKKKVGNEPGLPRRLMYLSDVGQYRQAQRAMTDAHVSQMRWFRWGWITVGRYMVVNDLRRERIG